MAKLKDIQMQAWIKAGERLEGRSMEIIAVHHRSSGFSDVLVTIFPPTDKRKIN
ncbi:hypothetical protein AB6T85_20890 [Erwinia sp. ACCC 02193]|uniref:Uncharacterized protein n=1 Tax=Erwinia aeris TaxID=3239803 RepID=A0ABV4ED47_9GAMM